MDPGHRRVGLQRRGTLTARHAAELVDEIAPLVRGARVRDVQSLPPRDVVLALDVGEALVRLRLSADGDAPRFHIVTGRVRGHRGALGPFFRQLEDELPGTTIADLIQVGGDRIVRLDLVGDDGPRSLVLELVGRHANLVLLAGDEVAALLVAPPHRAGEAQRLKPGEPWRAPPGNPPTDLGPSLEESYPLDTAPPPAETPLSQRVELVLGTYAAEVRREAIKKELLQRLKRKRKTLERTLAGLETRRIAADGAERIRQDGELLKSALGTFKRGATAIELDDWFDPEAPKRTLELDPRLTPTENLARLFKRAKKLLRDAASIEEDEERSRTALARIEELTTEAAEPDSDPEALDESAVAEGLLAPRQKSGPRKSKAPAPRLPYRSFLSRAGTAILVGRSARDNDELSLKIGRGSDLWLHTADAPGSHVVMRLARGAQPAEEDVLDAAHLALHFSPLRGARKADIHVARCKEVKKPKRAPAGLVTLSGGRTLHLRVEEERLKTLLDARGRRDAHPR